MPYVPGFAQDIFISYASEDRGWVAEFQNKLVEAMLERGLEAELWRDVDNIRFGQNWKAEMLKALGHSALFLAVLSPNYRQSDYCNDESDYFQKLREKNNDIKVGEQELYRYLKVVKLPWDENAQRGLLPDLEDIEFFTRDSKKRIDFPMAFTSQEFEVRIRLAAHSIEATLKAMRRLREIVFVASPADDVEADWKQLRTELRHQLYVVAPVAKLNRGLAPDFLRNEFKGSVLSIHLLGAEYHPLAERQLDLCAESGQKIAVWIKKGAGDTADPQQRKLLDGVRNFEKVPKGTPVIEGSSAGVPLTDLLELLRPAPEERVEPADGTPRVYLLCDPTVAEDREFALSLETSLEQRERMRVMLPQRDMPAAHERHQQMLRECDGVLLYREKAPESWFFQYFTDVARAEKLLKRAPIRSKAILAAADDLSDLPAPANVRLIPRTHPFSLDTLEPFLAPLRISAGAGHAGD
jgi:hypothetical protein